MKPSRTILQIVPRAPGQREGVGDYALTLARRLRTNYECETIFAAAEPIAPVAAASEFKILAPLAEISEQQWRVHGASVIILHYVNYGYQVRGIPFALARKVAGVERATGAPLLTIFHELYASGSWRQSAFWLQPFQKSIARALARRSRVCLLSSASLGKQLRELCPRARVTVRPVFSNFGEPQLTAAEISTRDQNRWAICGGTALIERSLRSFLGRFSGTAELFVLGGTDSPAVRRSLQSAKKISAHYLPNVDVATASATLKTCAFGWIDYFATAGVATDAILKSTAFAALCAHAVVPVLPVVSSRIALEGDALPGPFSLDNLPPETARPDLAQAVYSWYERNCSSSRLAETVAAEIA